MSAVAVMNQDIKSILVKNFDNLPEKCNLNDFDLLTTHQREVFVKLSMDIYNALKINMQWDNLFCLSGSAGVGKTFVTSKLVKLFKLLNYSTTITAPTHKALYVIDKMLKSNNINGVHSCTIHSFLNMKPVKDFDTGSSKFIPDKTKQPNTADILIVDECSMIDKNLFDYIMEAMYQDYIKVVLFIGDSYQLLPVSGESANLFNLKNRYVLSEIVRQSKGSYIIQLATKAKDSIKNRDYTAVEEFIKNSESKSLQLFTDKNEFLNDFYKDKNWDRESKIITSFTNGDVDFYNKIVRNRYWQERDRVAVDDLIIGDSVVFQEAHVINNRTIHQNNEEVEIRNIKKCYIENLNLSYWECIGSKNSDIFNILEPTSKNQFMKILDKISTDARNEKNYEKRKELWKQFFALKEFFIEVKYRFASTIHKLQGSTYDVVYIDLLRIANLYKTDSKNQSKDNIYRLIYVAITRASKDIKILINENDSKEFYSKAKDIFNSIDIFF